jgi:hypothetical protein
VKPYGPESLPLFFRDNDGEYMTDITLRDLFAGMAMQAMVTNAGREHIESIPVAPSVYSVAAYRLADAMLKEREK